MIGEKDDGHKGRGGFGQGREYYRALSAHVWTRLHRKLHRMGRNEPPFSSGGSIDLVMEKHPPCYRRDRLSPCWYLPRSPCEWNIDKLSDPLPCAELLSERSPCSAHLTWCIGLKLFEKRSVFVLDVLAKIYSFHTSWTSGSLGPDRGCPLPGSMKQMLQLTMTLYDPS